MKKNILFYLIASCVLGAFISYFFIKYSLENDKPVAGLKISNAHTPGKTTEESAATGQVYCDYNVSRLKGYKYVKPLLNEERECESEKYSSLKVDIQNFVDYYKRAGTVSYYSVFLKNLTTDEWMVINPNQGYHPGSMIKVAVLLTYLRMAETNPALLNNYIAYDKDNTAYPFVRYKSDSIILGNRYKVKDLLYFMIAHSDNRATVVLENYMDKNVFNRTFSDLGLPVLSFSDTSYRILPKTYTNFFSVIYNAGIVSITSSEFAASLLTESTFNEGIIKQLDPGIKVAHKFGEWGNGYQKELHETGIVYINDNPYILTVMTNGGDWNVLSNMISQISKMVYDRMSKRSSATAMK